MATKLAVVSERKDIERVRQEYTALREELRSAREQIAADRKTHRQLLESFQATHKEETRKLAQLKRISDSLEEENAQLKKELNRGVPGRNSTTNGTACGGQVCKEFENVGGILEAMQKGLMESSLLRNVKGKYSINQDDVDTLKDSFNRVIAELASLRMMITNQRNTAPNGMLFTALQHGSKTTGNPSNSFSGNKTSCPDDLVHLYGPVTENTLMAVLQERMNYGQCFTKLGPVLVSVNPFKHTQSPCPMDAQCLDAIMDQVMARLAERGIPQVFVLSGCSGSGKTYTAQALARNILQQGDGGLNSDVSKHFLASVTVLQSLTMAKIMTNSNSSRVGHLYEFYLMDGYVSKTKIQCYPLDDTRVVNSLPVERSYHIFYEMLSGITQDERAKLHLQGYSFYNLHYLSESLFPTEDENIELRHKFERWRVGLSTLGIPCTDVLRILAAILLLGNVQFVEGEGLELDVKGNNEIKAVAALLGVSGVSLYRGLTTKTKNLRGQVFRSLCEPDTANLNRDSLAMALYSRTLAAIVRRVNSFKRPTSSPITSPQGSGDGSPGSPGRHKKGNLTNGGILTTQQGSSALGPVFPRGCNGLVAVMDMFGFESSTVNQLEQICINLCSETIQHFYNTHIFKSSEEYCREEDMSSELDVDYVDNAPCIELLTCQRIGLLTLLDKESLFVRGTYENFLQSVREEQEESECFFNPEPERPCFTVSHHAGNVVYDARYLLDINRDSIPDDIVCVFSRQNCNFGFATHLFTSDLRSAHGQTAAPKGVAHRISPTHDTNSFPGSPDHLQTTFSQDFQGKLDSLLKTLVQAQPTFIRCIKANEQEESGVFDRAIISQQLKALQVFQTLRLLQSEFAHHSRFQAFVQKYGFLSSRPLGGREETEPKDCQTILETQLRQARGDKSQFLENSWVLGEKYVFFSDVMKQELDRCRDKRKECAVVTIQAFVRGWACRRQWMQLKRSLEMQRKARTHTRTNHRHGSSKHIAQTEHELSVDTKTAEQMCCLYGLDMEAPPPLPKSRPYTVMGNMKMGFPQTRIMKQDLPGGDGEVILRKGDHVKVVSAARKRGFLLVEHRNGTNVQVPFQITELKVSPHSSPR